MFNRDIDHPHRQPAGQANAAAGQADLLGGRVLARGQD
jgi:hypothetical protein